MLPAISKATKTKDQKVLESIPGALGKLAKFCSEQGCRHFVYDEGKTMFNCTTPNGSDYSLVFCGKAKFDEYIDDEETQSFATSAEIKESWLQGS